MTIRRPEVLFLAHRVPYPPDKGDRIRTYHLLRHLARRATVHLAALADEPVTEATKAALHTLCARVAVVHRGRWAPWIRAMGAALGGRTITTSVFYSPALARVIRRWAAQTPFHASLASSSGMIPYQRLPGLREVPAVVDLIDVDSQKWFDYAAKARGLRAWIYRTEGRRLRRLEQTLPQWARAGTLVSEAETELFHRFCPWDNVHAVTNGVDLDYFRPCVPAPVEDRACVFVGALDYRPNVDAVCWFSKEVWPQLRQRCGDVRFRLVGRRPVAEVLRLGQIPGVEVIGQVPDVRPAMAQSAVAVAPLRIARGIQNKVLEAMALARPLVASPLALVGLGRRPDLPALTAATCSEWVEHIAHLLDDAPLRRRLGETGRKYVETYHHWDRCLEPFGTLLRLPDATDIISPRLPGSPLPGTPADIDRTTASLSLDVVPGTA